MKKTIILFFSAVFVSVLLSGCNEAGSNPNIRHNPQNSINAQNPRTRLVLGSKYLVGRVALVDARIGNVGELTRSKVSVQNLTNKRFNLEYLFAWEDDQGFKTNDNPVWRRFVLAPREIKSFQAVGKTPDAYATTFTIRLPDDRFIQQEKARDD